MLRNYFKMAWKVARRRKFFTFVSLFGTAFTLTAICIVVAMADHQLFASYPEYQLDRILELKRMRMYGPKSEWSSESGFKTIDRYTRDLPGVERMTVYTQPSGAITFLSGRKQEFQMRFVDADYWRVLQFQFLQGGAFTDADHERARRVVVISESARKRFFGDASGVGQTIELDAVRYEVVGVVKDVPVYREIGTGEVWAPLSAQPAAGFFDRLMGGCLASYLVAPGIDHKQVQAAFLERMKSVQFDEPDSYKTMAGIPMTRLELMSNDFLDLQPEEAAPQRFIGLAVLAALAFMGLPALNLVNVNLSRIYERSSEIGVRKAFGASGRDLVLQFVVENVLLSAAAGVVALCATFAILGLAQLIPQVSSASFHLNWRIFLATFAAATVFGLLSGVWPAWRMSRQEPVVALKGGTS